MIENNRPTPRCSLCTAHSTSSDLAEAAWASPEVIYVAWRPEPLLAAGERRRPRMCPTGAPLCVARERRCRLQRVIQPVWPLDAEAAFGVIPTSLRLHAAFGGPENPLKVVGHEFDQLLAYQCVRRHNTWPMLPRRARARRA